MTDDVPLICDPVPGPWVDVERVVAEALVIKFAGNLALILGHEPSPSECLEQAGFELSGARTEWPDAEFCAALIDFYFAAKRGTA